MGLEFAVEGPTSSSPWPQLVASLVNLQILTAPFPNFGPSWSITCEVVYYTIWPLALMQMRGQVTHAAMSALLAAGMSVGAIFFVWHGMQMLQTSTALNGLWTISVLFPAWICGAWLGGNWENVSAMVTRQMWWAALMLCLAVMIL